VSNIMHISLPLYVIIHKKKKKDERYALNLNIYRNTPFFKLNKIKQDWKEIVREACIDQPKLASDGPFEFTYTIYPKTKRLFDLANVCSIVQKFTDDALIELGIISEDNYGIISKINYRFGEIDSENPRAELTVEEI
jgi:hypothetical protein